MERASSTKTAGISYRAPTMFRYTTGWRRPRSVAISDNLLTIIERDGTASALKFAQDAKDPSNASIIYATDDNQEFTLLSGHIGQVWAAFDKTTADFHRKAFSNRRAHWIAAIIVLTGIFGVLAGTWSTMVLKQKGIANIESDLADTQTKKWSL